MNTAKKRRWKMIVAYDGTGFAGWQRQKNGMAVQELLERAAASIFGEPVSVAGASRTDAGVHSFGQTAHFDQPAKSRAFTSRELLMGLNAHLPPQIRVMKISKAHPAFHTRFHASGKRYEYRIVSAKVMPPLEINRAWQVPHPLDLERMNRAAASLVGTHDFSAFAATSKDPRENTVRTIYRLDARQRRGVITITVEGDGFLYRMVRSISGALVRVGLGRESVEWVADRLSTGERLPGVVTAPAAGLYLVRVYYPPSRNALRAPGPLSPPLGVSP